MDLTILYGSRVMLNKETILAADLACYDGQNWVQSFSSALFTIRKLNSTDQLLPLFQRRQPKQLQETNSTEWMPYFSFSLYDFWSKSGSIAVMVEIQYQGKMIVREFKIRSLQYNERPQEKRWFEYGDLLYNVST